MSETESVQSENVAAGEINRLQQTPGFLLPDAGGKLLKDTNMPEYKRLCGLLDAAYDRSRDFQKANPVEEPEVPQSVISKVEQAKKELESVGFKGEALVEQLVEDIRDETSEVGIEQLRADIKKEVEQVNVLMEGSDIDVAEVLEEPSLIKLQGYKQMRLLAQEDYAALKPLIIKDVQSLGVPSNKIEQFRQFLSTAEKGDPMASDITNIIIKHIHKAKKAKSAGEFDID